MIQRIMTSLNLSLTWIKEKPNLPCKASVKQDDEKKFKIGESFEQNRIKWEWNFSWQKLSC
jgi:hypothetical protein